MYDAVNKKPVLCDNIVGRIGREVEGRVQEEWFKVQGWEEFKKEGIYVYLMPIHVDVRQKPLQYSKVIIF